MNYPLDYLVQKMQNYRFSQLIKNIFASGQLCLKILFSTLH